MRSFWLRRRANPLRPPLDEFRARRAALRQSLDDGVLLLKGQTEAYDPIFRFAQEPNFYYLTGWTEPGAALLLTPSDEILFLPRHNERAERYSGKRTSAEDADAHAVTGFEKVLPIEKLEARTGSGARLRMRAFTRPGPNPTPASCERAIRFARSPMPRR